MLGLEFKKMMLPVAAATLAVGMGVGTSAATASTVNDYSFFETFAGNDCAPETSGNPNALGDGASCAWDGSPIIAKFDFEDDGTTTFFPGAFPSITGSEFSFNINYDADDEEWAGTGSWTYTPDADDPGITAFSAKGGPNFSIYEKDSAAFTGVGDFSDTWQMPNNNSGNPAGTSHIVFFDTDTTVPIPIPAGGLLLITALGGLGFAARRRHKAG